MSKRWNATAYFSRWVNHSMKCNCNISLTKCNGLLCTLLESLFVQSLKCLGRDEMRQLTFQGQLIIQWSVIVTFHWQNATAYFVLC